MVKNRALFIGLGAGIIIGALLFQLMLLGEQSRLNLEQIGNETDERLYTQTEVDALLKAERDLVQIDEQTKTKAVKADGKAAPNEGKPDSSKPEQHVIRIEAGYGVTEAAELLAKHNIIQNEAAFINQMKNSNKRVRAGYFLFQERITVEEAITVVTSNPITNK